MGPSLRGKKLMATAQEALDAFKQYRADQIGDKTRASAQVLRDIFNTLTNRELRAIADAINRDRTARLVNFLKKKVIKLHRVSLRQEVADLEIKLQSGEISPDDVMSILNRG